MSLLHTKSNTLSQLSVTSARLSTSGSGNVVGVSSAGGYNTEWKKPEFNTKQLVLEWIMTYGESPVRMDAFVQKNPLFMYIDNKYLDKTPDMEEYALNEFAKALLVE
jgi:hypothetical protein